MLSRFVMGAAVVLLGCSVAMGDVFTYQGKLVEAGLDANGVYDFKFRMYDASAGPAQVGVELVVDDVALVDGLLTVDLDFGAGVFPGAGRWLEIDVKADAAGAYDTLAPRQPILPVPYAHHAAVAAASSSVADGGLPGTYTGGVSFTNPGNHFAGNGSGLTKLDATELFGALPNSVLNGFYTNAITFTNGTFMGDGSGLTNLPWASLTGIPAGFADGVDNDTDTTYSAGTGLNLIGTTFSLAAHGHDAADITSGSLNIARMPTGGSWLLNSNLSINGGTFEVDQSANQVNVVGNTAVASINAMNLGGLSGSSTIRGIGVAGLGPTNGYIGVQGSNDFDGLVDLDILGQEIGVLGVSAGGSTSDNTGVFGFSNGVGVRGVGGPIGTTYGLWAESQSATGYAAHFDGDVEVTGDLDVTGDLTVGGTVTGGVVDIVFVTGLGASPTATTGFLSPVASVTITAPNQVVVVTAHKAFGSTVAGGAFGLDLFIGYRASGSVDPPSLVGGGVLGNRVTQNTRVTMGLSGRITGLAPGTWQVGLAGDDNGNGNWNSNEWSYVTAMVIQQ